MKGSECRFIQHNLVLKALSLSYSTLQSNQRLSQRLVVRSDHSGVIKGI